MKKVLFILFVFFLSIIPSWSDVIVKAYNGYVLWLDSEYHGPVAFMYFLGKDLNAINTTEESKYRAYKLDDSVPDQYQQDSIDTYQSGNDKEPYHIGHLVPLDHMDSYEEFAMETRLATNVLPQTATFNLGAWRRTEKISECYREFGTILVIGGVIWGENDSDDYFIESHGIKTPDFFWKAIINAAGEIIVWKIPNVHTDAAKSASLDDHITSIKELENEGVFIPIFIPESLKTAEKPENSWDHLIDECTGKIN